MAVLPLVQFTESYLQNGRDAQKDICIFIDAKPVANTRAGKQIDGRSLLSKIDILPSLKQSSRKRDLCTLQIPGQSVNSVSPFSPKMQIYVPNVRSQQPENNFRRSYITGCIQTNFSAYSQSASFSSFIVYKRGEDVSSNLCIKN